MLNWLKRLLGIAPAAPQTTVNKIVRDDPPAAPKPKTPPKATAKPKKTTKKAAPKKAAVDLSAMKKDELLAHAKKSGAKVNASMKKADIIAAINAV